MRADPTPQGRSLGDGRRHPIHPCLLGKGEPWREPSAGRRARGRGPWVRGQRGGPRRVLGCGGAGAAREGRAQTSGSDRPQAQPARGSPVHGGRETGSGRRGSTGSLRAGKRLPQPWPRTGGPGSPLSTLWRPGKLWHQPRGQPWGAEWVSRWVFTQWRYRGATGRSRLGPRKGQEKWPQKEGPVCVPDRAWAGVHVSLCAHA